MLGMPWVLRERAPAPPAIQEQLRLLASSRHTPSQVPETDEAWK